MGAGERGRHTYGRWVLDHPHEARVVAVAEPDPQRRGALAAEHAVAAQHAVADWRQVLTGPRVADAVVIATPDRAHVEPAIAALERGYDVVLEKPIAPTPDGVRAVAEAAQRSTGTVTVAHVLRYTGFFAEVKSIVDAGRIGDLVTITHAEKIGYWHFAHSFVRGNWRRESESSPMILAKACHDLDLLRWLAGDRCSAVASFGGLRHFRAEEAPAGALERCWDGVRRCPVASACPFDAVRLYADRLEGVTDWPISVLGANETRDSRLELLATGPYGRCVYHSDNDVADHQLSVLEFANGVRATLTVSGFTADNTRTIALAGTRGELRGRLDTGTIELRSFLPGPGATRTGPWNRDELGRAALRDDGREVIETGTLTQLGGHAGGDDGLMRDVVERLLARRDGLPGADEAARTSLAVSIDSHLMAFAAEESRREGRLVTLADR